MSSVVSEKDRVESLYDFTTWKTPTDIEDWLFFSSMTLTASVFEATLGSVKLALGTITTWLELPYVHLFQNHDHRLLISRGAGQLINGLLIWSYWLRHTVIFLSERSVKVVDVKHF